jgi:hypothetical protein
MKMLFIAALVLTGSALTSALAPAQAMNFERHHVSDSNVDTIDMWGDIEHGDAERFKAYLSSLTDTGNIIGIRLNSEGGYIMEAVDLADLVAATHLATIVSNNAVCASACFYLFSAGNPRSVSTSARIGVHGASGSDKSDSMTIVMAKVLKKVSHIPDSIIVKMVTTASTDIAWLDRNDLTAMGVRIVEQQVARAPAPRPAPMPDVPHYSSGLQPAPQAFSNAFDAGRRDRLALQQWADGLGGDYKAGAEYWASVRNTPKAAQGCNWPSMSSAWINGCLAAQAKLTPMDARRRNEPDYKEGWNEASTELPNG